jgi:hypothetical protein
VILLPNLVELIKRAAVEAVNESKPTAVLFGKVSSLAPLKINIDQKLILGETQLVNTSLLNSLVVGDEVILLQFQGGQKFMVLEKVVEA